MPDNTGIIMLSILTPTIPERKRLFHKIKRKLIDQINYCTLIHPTLGKVEFLTDKGKRFLDGGLSIGKKREKLVKEAEGKYLCFLDDDEGIAPNYVEVLLRLCNQDKDVCSFRNISKFDNYWCVVDLSVNNPNEQSKSEDIVYRQPWHICPVRSLYAKIHSFEDSNYGEDWKWMERVLNNCSTEAKVNTVIHQYNHSSIVSEADKIVHP